MLLREPETTGLFTRAGGVYYPIGRYEEGVTVFPSPAMLTELTGRVFCADMRPCCVIVWLLMESPRVETHNIRTPTVLLSVSFRVLFRGFSYGSFCVHQQTSSTTKQREEAGLIVHYRRASSKYPWIQCLSFLQQGCVRCWCPLGHWSVSSSSGT